MSDNIDDDIDAIIGKNDLELDEIPEVDGASTPEDTPEDNPDEVEEKPEVPAEEPEVPPAPLTKEDIRSAITDMRTEEQASAKEISELTDDVLKQYYPDGLSNTLVDKGSGKELRSPQDVVDASGGEMSMDEAAKWLMNEQYKLDQNITQIKDEARNLAETNANFRSGVARVLDKYKDVFEKFPDQQGKVYKAYMAQVKMDNDKDLVLAAPDVEEFYDLVMEPYVLAYGNMQAQQPATQQQPSAEPKDTPAPKSKPSTDDRLDETGDGGGNKHEADPNNANETLNELFGE